MLGEHPTAKKEPISSASAKGGFFEFLTSTTTLKTIDPPPCLLNAHIFGHLPTCTKKIPVLRALIKYAAELRFTNWFHLNCKTRLSSCKVTLLVTIVCVVQNWNEAGLWEKLHKLLLEYLQKKKRSTGLP